MATKFFKEKTLTLAQQDIQIRSTYPAFQGATNRGFGRWVGSLQPGPLSPNYTIEITYKQEHNPEVRVLDPELKPREEGKPIPHMYGQETLCLYKPVYRHWTPSKSIAYTIIPWTSAWLYFYEVWFLTGEWLGGGEHPA